MNTTSVEFTAGLGGFLVVFALALALWLLGRDLTKRLRRMRLAEEQRLAQLQPQDDQAGDTHPGSAQRVTTQEQSPAAPVGQEPQDPDPIG